MRTARLGSALAFLAATGAALAAWGALRARVPGDGAGALAVDALGAALLLGLLAAAGAALSDEPLADRLGLRAGRLDPGALALAVVGLLGLSHAVEGLLTLVGAPASASLARFSAALSGARPAELALALAVFALGSAAAEELFFRGLLQRGLEPVVGGVAAVTIAALAFGGAHADAVHAAAALPLGLYLGALAWLAGSIRPALAAHAANNAVAVLEAGLGIQLPAGAVGVASIGVGLGLAALGLRGALRARPGPRGPDRLPGP